MKIPTSNKTVNSSNEFTELYSHSMIYTTSLVILSILIVLSNATILLLYLINSRIRSTKNFLLLSLAVSDLLAGLVILPINMSCFQHSKWNTCVASSILFRFLSFSTILHILTIIFEKYISILHPFCIVHKKHVRLISACLWTVSSSVAMIPMAWLPDGKTKNPGLVRKELVYFLVTFIGLFIVPLFLIVFAQVRMFTAISRSFTLVESPSMSRRRPVETITFPTLRRQSPTKIDNDSSIHESGSTRAIHNKKVLTAFALMLGTFTVCWLAWYLGIVLYYVDKETFVTFSKNSKQTLQVLVFLPSLVNPMLYTYYKQDFRLALRALLKASIKTLCH